MEEVLVRVTYTRGRDKGVSLYLPVWPSAPGAWRAGIAA